MRRPWNPARGAATALAIVLLAAGLTAQETRPAPPDPGELVFVKPLPETPVAWIDGKPIPASRLLKEALHQNFSLISKNLAYQKMLEMELARRELTVAEEEVEEELDRLLERMAPGRNRSDISRVGATSGHHLRRQAWTSCGWKKIYWETYDVPQDQRHSETNQLVIAFVMRNVQQNYEVRIRGQQPPPTRPGLVAEVKHKPSGNEVAVGANEALDFVMGLIKPQALLDILDSLVETELINRAMEEADVTVTREEVNAWAAEKRKQLGNFIPWEKILQAKHGITPDQAKERRRRILAWKRITGYEEDREKLMRFLEENKAFFMGAHKKVSHILIRTVDEVTGLSLGEEKEQEALERARTIYRKAMEGVSFEMLASRFSEDPVTARGEGRLASPVKPRGGSLDPNFRDAAWALQRVGDISEPVRSRFGWHVIRLDDINNGGPKEPDWTQEKYLEWIREEYETDRMRAFVDDLRDAAEVKLAAPSTVFELKERSYWEGTGGDGAGEKPGGGK